MPEKPLRIILLGSPIVIWEERAIAVARRQARALLFRLAATMQPVARDELILLLWPDTDEATARRNLTRLLSALRGELPHPDIIQTSPTAVSLNPALVWSDAVTFTHLAGGRNEAQWESAVSLVRGPLLDGFSLPDIFEFDVWQTQQQHAFERHYLAALANLVKANRRRGQLAVAIAYAQRYLATDDLAEEMHRHLIELFTQTGDYGAALRQFEKCVLVLERELGVAPLPETRAAYEAARERGSPAPPEAQPELEWAVLPSLDLPLVGREDALTILAAAYQRLHRGGVIFITGAAGVGKSRLMRAFARRSDTLVLTGNSQPDKASLPYQPLIQAMRQALPLRSRWQQTHSIWLAELARLLPELRSYFPNLPPAVDVEPEQAQARLFEALWQAFSGLATVDSTLILCLDDVHWVDTATYGWLQYLTPRLPGSGICLVAACRNSEQQAVDGWLRALQRADLIAAVSLEGLKETAIMALLDQLPESPPQAKKLAARIHAATGGNTFFVLETIRELLSTDQLTADAEVPLSPTVRETVLRRTGRFSPLARQVLEVTAVLSPVAILATIAEIAGRDEMKTADSLDELVGEQMLWSDGEQLHFQHALAKDAIYQNISLWRRRLLHKRAAHIMAKWPGANKELAVIAYHFEEAGEVMSAIDYYRRAATADAAIYAHQAAVDHLDRALSLAGQTPEAAADLPEIYEMLGDNLAILGNFTRAEATYRMLLTTIPPRDQLRLAATAGKLARTLPFQQRAIEAEQIYRLALARLETGVSPDESAILSVRLTILLGLLDAIYHQFKPEAMADLQGETEKLLTAAGTLEQQVGYYHSLNQRTFLQYGFRSPPENIDRANITLALAYESGNRRLIGRQCFHLGFHSLWSAKFGDAEENLRRALETAEEVGDSWLQVQSLVYLSIAYRLKGDKNRLQKVLPALTAQTKEAGHSTYIAVDHAQRAWGHFRASQWSQARGEAQTALSIWANASAPYPFEWLANWILLAQALQERRLTEAVAAARAMLLPKQQKFSNEIEEALQSADSAWEADDVAGARDALETAVGLAHARSYL